MIHQSIVEMQQCKENRNSNFYHDGKISPLLTLTKQTSHFLLTRLTGNANLIKYLLNENHIPTLRYLSDLNKSYFSNYMQMSGRSFLVSKRELDYSEKLLALNNFIEEDVNLRE